MWGRQLQLATGVDRWMVDRNNNNSTVKVLSELATQQPIGRASSHCQGPVQVSALGATICIIHVNGL